MAVLCEHKISDAFNFQWNIRLIKKAAATLATATAAVMLFCALYWHVFFLALSFSWSSNFWTRLVSLQTPGNKSRNFLEILFCLLSLFPRRFLFLLFVAPPASRSLLESLASIPCSFASDAKMIIVVRIVLFTSFVQATLAITYNVKFSFAGY